MNEIDRFRKMLAIGNLKEAAEWVKEGPLPFFDEADVRSVLMLLADAILEDKPRLGHFEGQRSLTFVEHDRETGTNRNVTKVVSLEQWERYVCAEVRLRVDAKGRVKRGAYKEVSALFFPPEAGEEARGRSEANIKRIYEKHK